MSASKRKGNVLSPEEDTGSQVTCLTSMDSSSDNTSSSETSSYANRRRSKNPLLQDSIVLNILNRVKNQQDRKSCSAVNKLWLKIEGSLRKSIIVYDWDFLENGRMSERFPNLTHVDLTRSWNGFDPKVGGNWCPVTMTNSLVSMSLNPSLIIPFMATHVTEEQKPSPRTFDIGLEKLVNGCKSIVSLSIVDICRNDSVLSSQEMLSVRGIRTVLDGLPNLQEIEIRQCCDQSLFGFHDSKNLQKVKLMGGSTGFYHASFTDSGLQYFAMNCRKLTSLSLAGCEVGFNGLIAVAKYCPLLSDLTLGGKTLQSGWMRMLQFCLNLKSLKIVGLKSIDRDSHCGDKLGKCPNLSRLEMENTDVRPVTGFRALIDVCQNVRELFLKNCWGLEDDYFAKISICRGLTYLKLEGCSLITTYGFESVAMALKDLRRLSVSFCSKIKEEEMGKKFSEKIYDLEEWKWQPDTQKFFLDSLKEAGVGEKGRWLLENK